MPDSATQDPAGQDRSARAAELVERGIDQAKAGDLEAAGSDLREAESLAREAGDAPVLAAALINQGWVAGMTGDRSAAVALYEEAARTAKAADDLERLRVALANLGVELAALGDHVAVESVVSDYIELLPEQDAESRSRALVSRALSRIERGENDAAVADLDEADTLAAEVGDAELTRLVRFAQGHAFLRGGDATSARAVLAEALGSAQASGALDDQLAALMTLGQADRALGDMRQAAAEYGEAERLARTAGDRAVTAEALYWRGVALYAVKQTDEALAAWREAETIRRELDQDGFLADCLYAQADAMRRRGDHESADPLYAEAEERYLAAGLTQPLANSRYWHGASRWAARDPEGALTLVAEVFDAGGDAETSVVRRALGLRAMALADLGRGDEAEEALDDVEERCLAEAAHSTMVWMLARRAYVMARTGADDDAIVGQLRRAHRYGMEHELPGVGRDAVRRISIYIVNRCEGDHGEALQALRVEQEAELDPMAHGVAPRSVPEGPASPRSATKKKRPRTATRSRQPAPEAARPRRKPPSAGTTGRGWPAAWRSSPAPRASADPATGSRARARAPGRPC